MLHRKKFEENRSLGFINVNNLDFSKIREENEKLMEMSTDEDKLLYITKV